MVSAARRPVVLLSGGVDSAVVLASLASMTSSEAVWFDYGQPAATSEARASAQIAEYYGVPHRQVVLADIAPPQGGEVPHRNDLLVATAAALYPRRNLAMGIHTGTGYADCSPAWVAGWQRLFDLQQGGECGVVAPLLRLGKTDVYALAKDLKVPLELTHSCEAANVACGQCSSCADRRLLDACA